MVVVGGGLAGLSAAVEAADGGAAVTLLERRPRLGGATWSFERNGIWFDNGQHVFMRCCTAYRAFLERIGSAGGVRMQDRLDVPVMAPGGPVGSIRRTPGPAPLHLAPALLSYPHLNLRQRLAVLRAGLALRRLDPDDPTLDDMTFGAWLSAHGQDATAIETFWNLIVLPTVNASAAEASLKLAAKVFVTGLLTEAGAADIGLARVPLSALHGDAARRALEAGGGEVRSRVPVKAVRSGAAGLEVRTDEQVFEADSVVVAVPHDAVAGLLPPGTVAAQDRLVELGTSPIVNVHLVYDRPITDLAFFATVGSDAQFVFDRTEGAGLDDGRQCLAVSLSAAESYIGMASADLVSHFIAELARLLPRGQRRHRHRVDRHPRALGHLPRRAGNRHPASRHRVRPPRRVSGRCLERHRLAGHDGGGGPQWNRGRPPRGPLRIPVRERQCGRFSGPGCLIPTP